MLKTLALGLRSDVNVKPCISLIFMKVDTDLLCHCNKLCLVLQLVIKKEIPLHYNLGHHKPTLLLAEEKPIMVKCVADKRHDQSGQP